MKSWINWLCGVFVDVKRTGRGLKKKKYSLKKSSMETQTDCHPRFVTNTDIPLAFIQHLRRHNSQTYDRKEKGKQSCLLGP